MISLQKQLNVLILSAVTAVLVALAVAGCAKSTAGSGDEVSVAELDRALGMWTMAQGKPPQTVYDLTNLPVLQGRRLPALPSGKKLTLSPDSKHVVISDQ